MLTMICAVILGAWVYDKYIKPELGNKENKKKEENSTDKKETK